MNAQQGFMGLAIQLPGRACLMQCGGGCRAPSSMTECGPRSSGRSRPSWWLWKKPTFGNIQTQVYKESECGGQSEKSLGLQTTPWKECCLQDLQGLNMPLAKECCIIPYQEAHQALQGCCIGVQHSLVHRAACTTPAMVATTAGVGTWKG